MPLILTALSVLLLLGIATGAINCASPADANPNYHIEERLQRLEHRAEYLEHRVVELEHVVREQQHRIVELYAAVHSLDDHDHGFPTNINDFIDNALASS